MKEFNEKEELDFNTDDEFRNMYPQYCYRGKPIHPYIDIFAEGVEIGKNLIERGKEND